MMEKKTNWERSVSAVVIKEGKVLLARHTYGAGKGKFIIPGGYLEEPETPEEAVVREVLEETGILVRVKNVIGIRFNARDWYVGFSCEYLQGEPNSDHDENDMVVWMDVDEALVREDVPMLTKSYIKSAMQYEGLVSVEFNKSSDYLGKNSLYINRF